MYAASVSLSGLPHRIWRPLPPLARLRWQLPLVVMFCAVLPALIGDPERFWDIAALRSNSNAFLAALACSVSGLFLFRRLGSFPGVTSFGQVAPAVLGPYLIALILFVGLRLDYSRLILALGAIATAITFFGFWIYCRRRCVPVIYALPGTPFSPRGTNANVIRLLEPREDLGPNSVIVADLRNELTPRWESFLLDEAMRGVAVYHYKSLLESLTGMVEVEHLSENSFGSVVPNQLYLRTKWLLDLLLAIAVVPIFLIIGALVAVAIKLDSPGPVFFVQPRCGFRGRRFRLIKFRTMEMANPSAQGDARRELSKTLDQDPRITRVGRFLRRHRLDELPQIVNIIRGEMSWIGPRPECCELSDWYYDEISYYGYRHMVRPGITGWAQVQQGHVFEVAEVRRKLYFDFYYIKYFSVWLDALIMLRTARALMFGRGAR
jgi:lipopolysaccharide/colanic/teichoic acid biosynthesis glycosyltransferase